jgi:ABC-type amino acid transport substrate-binding protein
LITASKAFQDLKRKNLVTTAGSTAERMLKVMNAEKKMNMNVISAKDMSESYPMLESDRAIAFMQGDALLAGEVAKTKKPEDWATGPSPRNPTNSMVVQYVGGIRISKKSWITRSSRFSSRAKSTPSTINGLLSPSLPKA